MATISQRQKTAIEVIQLPSLICSDEYGALSLHESIVDSIMQRFRHVKLLRSSNNFKHQEVET
ncbi:hypothetical protein BBBOND_0300690 [Babesia bigemina]|uniref:Uncharacterized protein n=1 Tax=Babesia bigemina TaxID=5866 RepID=A0A061DB76_BABBI|nr:hypothetical protein BBBOND_0300690 [Babesia bigemina]CDR96164.1 hypothetical protein BBBOND_0300690 [Babesia bigemina]|eukprot:XP_012768350.1 hypothetical protein BBBOND_0300690 [Babesia bigemina]